MIYKGGYVVLNALVHVNRVELKKGRQILNHEKGGG